jgi:uncharacterized protein (DUF2147 family)
LTSCLGLHTTSNQETVSEDPAGFCPLAALGPYEATLIPSRPSARDNHLHRSLEARESTQSILSFWGSRNGQIRDVSLVVFVCDRVHGTRYCCGYFRVDTMGNGLKFSLKVALGTFGACVLIPLYAGTTLPTAAGTWKQIDNSGKVGALVTITEENGVFVGRLSKLFLDPGDDPHALCVKCTGEKHNQPILGLVFIEGMKQSGLDYQGGTILDPETGDIYKANMSLDPKGKKLTVRGYIGLPIFGRSQTWTRVK